VETLDTEAVVEEIRRTRTVTSTDGATYPIGNHGIDRAEGRFLSEFIARRPSIIRTLEVGCAYGFSSLYIVGALAGRKGAHHVIIDPSQSSDWDRIGVTNLDRIGVDFYELREEPSELALPQLLKEGDEFDLIFIDGGHTFDQVLVDMYFASRLIKPGGYIVLDDAGWPSVSKAVSNFAKYPCFKIVGGSSVLPVRIAGALVKVFAPFAELLFPHWLYDHVYRWLKYPTMVAIEKVAEDQRSFKWFRSF
jgi:predicted O-methyltransferase YrrM